MLYNPELEWLQRQLDATEDLLHTVGNSLLMKVSLENRIQEIKEQMANVTTDIHDARLDVWFSGDSTFGSQGISTGFMESTMHSLVGMIQASTRQKIRVLRQQKKKANMPKGKFYITGLTHGSFGYEMAFKEQGQIFSDETTIESIKDVIGIIEETASSDLNIDKLVAAQPVKLLSHLRDFLTITHKESSVIRMASGGLGINLDIPHVRLGYDNICLSNISEKEESLAGVFQGAFIESGKFEYTDDDNKVKHGKVSEDLSYEEIAEINRTYSRKQCILDVVISVVSYSNGKKRETVELTGIRPI